jgi:hypothetical protein
MLAITLINILLLARLLLRRRRVIEKDVEAPLEVVDDEDPILIDVANLEEIRPVQVNGNVDIRVKVDEERIEAEIQTLVTAERLDACKYCFIFKDLSSVVCPNCGRLLKVTPRVE